ncbi:hypothetical protein BJ138DRAFT_1118161 [Hygrophoropsis aurantiaca]|uniref:Uncharacterized protein n=1 Tax=Hygrophoropsis aurantiaca TaxID=72124 RepID=A0ACB7ZYI6_9AGAM|nr:hypothetical protein BJ138DRAFT_1118161 [Hygrophoropsis aurantiaca]
MQVNSFTGNVTFTVQEFLSALQLIKTQNDIFSAHENDIDSAPPLLCGATAVNEDFIDIGSLTVVDGIPDSDGIPATQSEVIDTPAVQSEVIDTPAVQSEVIVAAAPGPSFEHTPANWRWYAITVGSAVGVFHGWHNTHPHVIGVAGACFLRYPSEASAISAFEEAELEGTVTIVT